MSKSTWVFDCELGLHQDSCGSYVADEQSRGYGKWSGCASCDHRQPASDRTLMAENNWLATGHSITPHKGGRTISKHTSVTPQVAEALARLKREQGISLADVIEVGVKHLT